MRAGNILFSNSDIFGVVEHRKTATKEKLAGIPANKLLAASEDDLVDALVTEFTLDVPMLTGNDYVANSGEERVDVSRDPMRMIIDRSGPFYVTGNKTVVALPFTGDAAFFKVRPQAYTLGGIRADVSKTELLLTYLTTTHDGDAIRREYEQTTKTIREHLRSLAESARQFNDQLPSLIRAEIVKRKERLLKDAGMVASLGLPLKKRDDIPLTVSIPVSRRVPRVEEIRVEGAFKPEPGLSMDDYDEILRIMKNMVGVMELSPHAFETMGEEDLRFHFLVQLNGFFNGQATGETFNFQGKTDILVRVDSKNIFIAECKFWKGEKAYLETIDQLLSYLSWRDTKTAVVVFNRNDGFTAVLDKVAKATPTHSNFKRLVSRDDVSTFRYVFSQPADSSREVILTVMCFDVPKAGRKAG